MKVEVQTTIVPATAEQHCAELMMLEKEGDANMLSQAIFGLQTEEGKKKWPNGIDGINLYYQRRSQA